jgi:mRNA interferase MazF
MPHRGEVWFVELSMAEKPRPALIISSDYGDKDRALITIVPHTTALRGSELEVGIQARFLDRRGAFMVQSVTTIPSFKAKRCVGVLTKQQLATVEEKIRIWLASNYHLAAQIADSGLRNPSAFPPRAQPNAFRRCD